MQSNQAYSMPRCVEEESNKVKDEEGRQEKNGAVDKMQKRNHADSSSS